MIDFELSDGQKNIQQLLHWFAKSEVRPIAQRADKEGGVPQEFVTKIKNLGLAGGAVPKEYGGEGEGLGESKKSGEPSQTARLGVIGAEEMAWGDAGVILSFPGPGLGAPPLRAMGTPDQQKRFFSIFKDGDPKWGAFALTEPGAGSDVAGISMTAVKDGKYYILNGAKCFITNGARASWNVVFATVDKSKGRGGHRAFIVNKDTPGFRVGKIEKKMGLKASETAELVFEDCKVPEENLLGGEEYYRRKEGFKGAMGTFDVSRPLVGAMAVGIARAAYEYARNYAKERYQFGRPIARYQSIANILADMSRKINAARLLCWRAAWMVDLRIPNSKEASMAKAYSAQIAMDVCNNAIEILGGHGCVQEHPVEKWFRDIKVFDIFEGTGQVQRIVISRRILEYTGESIQ